MDSSNNFSISKNFNCVMIIGLIHNSKLFNQKCKLRMQFECLQTFFFLNRKHSDTNYYINSFSYYLNQIIYFVGVTIKKTNNFIQKKMINQKQQKQLQDIGLQFLAFQSLIKMKFCQNLHIWYLVLKSDRLGQIGHIFVLMILQIIIVLFYSMVMLLIMGQ